MTDLDHAAQETAGDAAHGWYLYGITRREPLAAWMADANARRLFAGASVAAQGEAAPLQLLEFSGLAAVVRPVRLADYTLAAVRERLQNASALEATVRSHNHVIEAIHDQQAILPAKFGMVYAHADDVVSALRPAHDKLLRQLSRLDGCDEWAVHVHADRASVRERVSTANPAIRRLRDERTAARPGRAYFLEQQLRDELEASTDQEMVTLAQNIFDRLVLRAVAGQVNPVAHAADRGGEMEILRASFLVTRNGADRFEAEVRAAVDINNGLRCESTGPWPPYSFAASEGEEA
jgi:Gas vesicle synthesis protein GvpL/GvpF